MCRIDGFPKNHRLKKTPKCLQKAYKPLINNRGLSIPCLKHPVEVMAANAVFCCKRPMI